MLKSAFCIGCLASLCVRQPNMSVVSLTGISADNASVQKEEVVDDFAGSDYTNVVNVQDGGVGVAAAPIVLSPMVGQGGA